MKISQFRNYFTVTSRHFKTWQCFSKLLSCLPQIFSYLYNPLKSQYLTSRFLLTLTWHCLKHLDQSFCTLVRPPKFSSRSFKQSIFIRLSRYSNASNCSLSCQLQPVMTDDVTSLTFIGRLCIFCQWAFQTYFLKNNEVTNANYYYKLLAARLYYSLCFSKNKFP